ncbi:hypothetical protein GIB67_033362 [Kingdonia uniflora]|uniref:KIB1-4 beta-propeller domain-containing protein n=1 Tax=Kingdonia uniflora TaxID=39325 RepID=A0A7J7LTM5_9MAGN|nr:hypothetical protein GIB67_033362 [Kingdonia uniflora]
MLEKNCRSGIRNLPWAMFPKEVPTDRDTFFSISTKKFYYLRLPPKMLHECSFCLEVSPFGWLIVQNYRNRSHEYTMNLLNPLTRVRIQLPPFNRLIRNTVLSSSPLPSRSHNNCIVMIINDQRKLSFAKLGDNTWTPLEEHEVADELLLVRHHCDEMFEVYKFDFSIREWKKLNNFGDFAVFVGVKSSFALSSLEYPGLKGGCIYFFAG